MDIYFKSSIFFFLCSLTEFMVASGSKVQGFKLVYTANVEQMLNSGNFDKKFEVWVQKLVKPTMCFQITFHILSIWLPLT